MQTEAAAAVRPCASSRITFSAGRCWQSRIVSASPGSSSCGRGSDATSAGSDSTFTQPSRNAASMRAFPIAWERAESSRCTAGGMSTAPYRSRNKPSLPMVARFDTGEVSLTTRFRHAMERVLHGVIPRDAALGEFAAEAKLIQSRHARRLAEAQPAFGIIAAGEFDLHVPLTFPRSKRQCEERRFVNFQRDGRDASLSNFPAQTSLPLPPLQAGHDIESATNHCSDMIGLCIRTTPARRASPCCRRRTERARPFDRASSTRDS